MLGGKPEKNVETKVAGKIAPGIIQTMLQNGVDFEITSGRKTRKFIIYPINLGTLFNISNIIVTMGDIALPDGDVFSVGIKNIIDNKDKMIEIVALAILNKKQSIWTRFRKRLLVRYINRNMTAKELLKLIQLVIVQMDVTDFLASFVSIKRLNLVEAKSKETLLTTGELSAV